METKYATENQLINILVDYEEPDKSQLFNTQTEFSNSLNFKPLESIRSIFISTWERSRPLNLKIRKVDDFKRWVVTKNDEISFFFFFSLGSPDNFLDLLWKEYQKKIFINQS